MKPTIGRTVVKIKHLSSRRGSDVTRGAWQQSPATLQPIPCHDRLRDMLEIKLPTQSRVVICGGGVVGCSVAYHLAYQFGWNDVLILEQGRLGGGTTWHGAGLLGQIKRSVVESELCQYSINLYRRLQSQGMNTGWKECGSLMLARTKDRMTSFRRLQALGRSMNVESELLSPGEAQKLCSILSKENLEGAMWIPLDGVGDPYETCITLATEAHRLGVKIVENCCIQRVITDEANRVAGVETSRGPVSCEYFVNSAGYWARHVGMRSNPQVKVPLYPCEHHYLHTQAMQSVDVRMPAIRDYDGYFYIREKDGRYLAGGFEPTSKPLDLKDPPDSFRSLPEDWDHFYTILDEILFRIPSLADAKVDRLCNGPEAFTPDGKWILGEAPEIRNYFVGSGMKSIGIEAAGGVGKVIAEWMANSEPNMNIWDLDIRRFLGLHNNQLFLRDRMKEVPGLHYKIPYPHQEFKTGRCLRMSPIYPRFKSISAVFGQIMGYERPCYFVTDLEGSSENHLGIQRAPHCTFGKPPWFEYVKSEYKACRERVALLDYSSFTKIDLWSPGREVVDLLQFLCSNDADIPVGSIVHTGMQNYRGGYENDCSLVRLAQNHYMVIAPTVQQTRCQTWIKRHLPVDSPVAVSDVTSMYTAICVMGPQSRNLMSDLTDTSMTSKDFPFFTCKELDVGLASGVRVMNLTHTGELGWVLYIPNEYALHAYDRLLEVGAKYGIQHAGHFAMRSLRLEKFYALWGNDLDTTTTPLECGRGFRVKFDKSNFIGKDALLREREEGSRRRYVQLLLEDHDMDNDTWPWGTEPIYLGDKRVGFVCTTGYGFTVEKQVCLGFIQNFGSGGEHLPVTTDYLLKNNFEVDIAGKRYHAKVNIHSPKLSFTEHGYGSGYMATR